MAGDIFDSITDEILSGPKGARLRAVNCSHAIDKFLMASNVNSNACVACCRWLGSDSSWGCSHRGHDAATPTCEQSSFLLIEPQIKKLLVFFRSLIHGFLV